MSNFTTIKIQNVQDIRRTNVPSDVSFSSLLKIIKGLFKEIALSEWSNVTLKYMDTEEDLCSITNNEELKESFRSHNRALLKVFLTFDVKEVFGYRALESQFPVGGASSLFAGTNFIPPKDRISTKEFENAKNVMNIFLQEAKQPVSHPFAKVREESINSKDFTQAKFRMNLFLQNKSRKIVAIGVEKSKVEFPNSGKKISRNQDSQHFPKFEVIIPKMDSIQFKNAQRVVSKHLEKRVQTLRSMVITPYAAMYIDSSKPVNFAKTPLIEYAHTIRSQKLPEADYVKELWCLFRMGFCDDKLNREALIKTQGNLADAVQFLLCSH